MNSIIDKEYKELLRHIISCGTKYEDPNRKGVERLEIPVYNLVYTEKNIFPIVSVRRSYFKGAVGELLLFLKGETDIRRYWEYGIKFWDEDFKRFQNISEEEFLERKESREGSNESFSLGDIYGAQYARQYNVFDNFKKNPSRSDLIVDSWQLDSLDRMSLKPCHNLFQIVGSPNGFYISWYQRSVDALLGLPMNIQFYYLLGKILEFWTGDTFIGISASLNKVHLYDNQVDLACKVVKASEDRDNCPDVVLEIPSKLKTLPFREFIQKLEPTMFKLQGYKPVVCETVEMLTYNK